ncbi:MAG: PaaI family thioesterase [Gemmatimonadaceae bacterium]
MSEPTPIESFIDRIASGEIELPTLGKTLGMEFGTFGEGTATFTLNADPDRHGNVMGTLHGGVLAAVADTAMGFAFATTLAVGETFATLEIKVSFLRPVWRATLTAAGHVLHRGKTTGLVECRVTDERDRLVVHATSTCLVLRDEQAQGRKLGDRQPG